MDVDKLNHEIVQEILSPCNTKVWVNSVAGCLARYNPQSYELATMTEGVVHKFDDEGVSFTEFKSLVKKHFDYEVIAQVL